LPLRKPLVGILIHPWDIKDEGIHTIAETLSGLGITSAFIAANAPAEEHPPQPVDARLTHNPKRKRYVSEEGRFYYELDPAYYVNSTATPRRSADGDLAGYDTFAETDVFVENGIKTFAWLTALHNGQFVQESPELAVVDVVGEADKNWMCPSNPNVAIQMLESVNEIQKRYQLGGIVLDNFWWKYPHTFMPSLESGMVCFCDHCQQRMELAGIDIRSIRKALVQIPRAVRNLSRSKIRQIGKVDTGPLLEAVGLPLTEAGGYADVMSVLFEDPEQRENIDVLAQRDPLGIFEWFSKNTIMFDWLDMKADALRELLVGVYELAKTNDPSFELGLMIWSPRSSWSVCQSYRKLRDACDWIMPMAYNKLWGWYSSSVAEELFEIVHPKTPRLFASHKEILGAWFKLAGYTARPLKSLIFNGLPPALVGKELSRARQLAGDETVMYAGVQAWEPGSRIPHPEEIAEAAEISLSSGVDGLIIQAYGWAPMPNLISTGRVIQRFLSDRSLPGSSP
jgi:hypothetical protein